MDSDALLPSSRPSHVPDRRAFAWFGPVPDAPFQCPASFCQRSSRLSSCTIAGQYRRSRASCRASFCGSSNQHGKCGFSVWRPQHAACRLFCSCCIPAPSQKHPPDKLSSAVAGAVFFSGRPFIKEMALAILPFILALEITQLSATAPAKKIRAFGRLIPYAVFMGWYLIMRKSALLDSGVRIEILPGLGRGFWILCTSSQGIS